MIPAVEAALLGTLAGDALRLLLMVLGTVAVYAIARWAANLGRGDDPGMQGSTLQAPTSIYQPTGPVRDIDPRRFIDPEAVVRSFPVDPALGRIRITKFYFRKLDALTGPPDPEVFGDELNVELYDPVSDRRWWQLFFVASPQGLAQILREKSWRYLYAEGMLVVPRYDLEEIRRAVVSRVLEDNELFKTRGEREETL